MYTMHTRCKKLGHLNIKTKMFNFEERVLIGWLLRIYASQPIRTRSSKSNIFPGPLAFCKKAVERVSSEKNILNSSVECVEWSGVVIFRKSHMYVHHQIRLNELINMMYFIFNLNAFCLRN